MRFFPSFLTVAGDWFSVIAAISILLVSCDRSDFKTEQPQAKVEEKTGPRKYYLISSPHSKRHYPTWEYEILPAGGVRFKTMDQGGKVIVVSQPYEIEERNAGKGW